MAFAVAFTEIYGPVEGFAALGVGVGIVLTWIAYVAFS